MPIDNHDKDMRHSLYGRKFGIDDRGLLVGTQDIRHGTETLGTTVSSTLSPAGTSILSATVGAVYELVPPAANMVGVCKRIINNSTAAVAHLVKLSTAAAAGGNFTLNGLTTQNTLTLSTRGAAVDLEYISTSLVQVITPVSSLTTGFYSFSTTT